MSLLGFVRRVLFMDEVNREEIHDLDMAEEPDQAVPDQERVNNNYLQRVENNVGQVHYVYEELEEEAVFFTTASNKLFTFVMFLIMGFLFCIRWFSSYSTLQTAMDEIQTMANNRGQMNAEQLREFYNIWEIAYRYTGVFLFVEIGLTVTLYFSVAVAMRFVLLCVWEIQIPLFNDGSLILTSFVVFFIQVMMWESHQFIVSVIIKLAAQQHLTVLYTNVYNEVADALSSFT